MPDCGRLEFGKTTKTSPMGTIEQSLHPIDIALSAEATYVARTFDTDPQHLAATIEHAAGHKGSAFVEVLQDCNIFNHKTWFHASQKATRSASTCRFL